MKRTKNNVLRLELIKTIDLSYDLVFDVCSNEIAADMGERMKQGKLPKKTAIITDTNVGPLHAGGLEEALQAEGFQTGVFNFEAGEENKTMDTAKMLSEKMGHAKYGRDCFVIALGGGVVGDTAGFVAGITRRGVSYVQIPTSTLAIADSSIGGKTGVDLETGKNLVGLFKHPSVVYFNFEFLKTLPDNEFREGLAETIKHGMIKSAEFYRYLEVNYSKILEKDPSILRVMTEHNCRIKGGVVEKDPDEDGLRKILNYGHTVGHAVEILSDYQLSHGACVGMGMMVAGKIAIMMDTGFTENELMRQEALLENVGIKTSIPLDLPTAAIVDQTSMDKKVEGGLVNYCLPEGRGIMCEFSGKYSIAVPPEIVTKAIDQSR